MFYRCRGLLLSRGCRWEEKNKEDGVKWKFLEHKGPCFAPPYEPLPDSVRFVYNGKKMPLNPEAEEVAGFYARMIEHEYTSKQIFQENFMRDWRKVGSLVQFKDLQSCKFCTDCNIWCSYHYRR